MIWKILVTAKNRQWIDWKRRVDRERAQAAERGNRAPGKRSGASHHHEGAKPHQEPFNFYAPYVMLCLILIRIPFFVLFSFR